MTSPKNVCEEATKFENAKNIDLRLSAFGITVGRCERPGTSTVHFESERTGSLALHWRINRAEVTQVSYRKFHVRQVTELVWLVCLRQL